MKHLPLSAHCTRAPRHRFAGVITCVLGARCVAVAPVSQLTQGGRVVLTWGSQAAAPKLNLGGPPQTPVPSLTVIGQNRSYILRKRLDVSYAMSLRPLRGSTESVPVVSSTATDLCWKAGLFLGTREQMSPNGLKGGDSRASLPRPAASLFHWSLCGPEFCSLPGEESGTAVCVNRRTGPP